MSCSRRARPAATHSLSPPCATFQDVVRQACRARTQAADDEEVASLAARASIAGLAWKLANRAWLLPYPQRAECSGDDFGDCTAACSLDSDDGDVNQNLSEHGIVALGGRLQQPCLTVGGGLPTKPIITAGITAVRTPTSTLSEAESVSLEFEVCAIAERAEVQQNAHRIALALALLVKGCERCPTVFS